MCNATDGNMGVCYTEAECSAGGGVATGSCASAFGVCCVCKFISNYIFLLSFYVFPYINPPPMFFIRPWCLVQSLPKIFEFTILLICFNVMRLYEGDALVYRPTWHIQSVCV